MKAKQPWPNIAERCFAGCGNRACIWDGPARWCAACVMERPFLIDRTIGQGFGDATGTPT